MLISLHKQAATTPMIRAAIQASTGPAWMVSERYGVSEQTVWKWRKRDSVHDLSHTPHRLQTTLCPAQEAVAVTLRKTLLLPLDDLLAVVREFLNPCVSRSGLDRCRVEATRWQILSSPDPHRVAAEGLHIGRIQAHALCGVLNEAPNFGGATQLSDVSGQQPSGFFLLINRVTQRISQ